MIPLTIRNYNLDIKEQVPAEFFIKADDDAYLNIDPLVTKLRTLVGHPSSFYCHVVEQNQPLREAPKGSEESKWLAPYWMYPLPRYPPYCAGTVYSFRGDLREQLYRGASQTPLLAIEDVFLTGESNV